MTRTRSAPTLDDVAQLAGVSTATVSRCLNAPDRVVEGTRKKVLAAVDELGYTPNFGARAMAAKRTFTIGAIIPTMDNAIFARGIQAFQEALFERGYTLLVASSSYDPQVEADQIRSLVARGADGLFLIGYERDPAVYDYLAQQSVPVLISWAFDAQQNVPTVGFDNRKGMRAIAEAIIGLGHRRIAVVSGMLDGNDRTTERVEGIREALSAHGIDPDTVPVLQTPYEIDNGTEAFKSLMTSATPPTAVICGNDVLAVGALLGAQDLGLTVPADVSITGFDDIELARIVTPALTTVHVPHRDMGRKAAEALIEMVETKAPVASVEIPITLKMRGSLAPPKE
ncbi:LacI family DNA-binding transcriptional regulator [Marivita hallyeonensis]|uniref:Transcriptional regulator, LacI family n=1 Tax=Marivita hallyeonensis TaxID=996342 RepID=A0A1M5RU45_9RHOB|nr:LacI family DNA-binding transcriptional regulator [Marivita hallyeonensis]SHH29558.1 transcriptional regulator, LacI family [Marivita hallyeonensis]